MSMTATYGHEPRAETSDLAKRIADARAANGYPRSYAYEPPRQQIGGSNFHFFGTLAISAIGLAMIGSFIQHGYESAWRERTASVAISESCFSDGEATPTCRFVPNDGRDVVSDSPSEMSYRIVAHFSAGKKGLASRPAASTGDCLLPANGPAYCIDTTSTQRNSLRGEIDSIARQTTR